MASIPLSEYSGGSGRFGQNSATSSLANCGNYRGSQISTQPSSVFSSYAQSTTLSTAPTGPLEDQMDTMTFNDQRCLPCLLGDILGCTVEFDLDDFDDWYTHDLSHFGQYGPPENSQCIFCDGVFKGGSQAYRARMSHIADHLEYSKTVESSRPDFEVINRLYKKKLISQEDYEWAIAGSERPQCKDTIFRPLDWKPDEMVQREEAEERRDNKIVVKEPRRRTDTRSKSRKTSSKSHKTYISRD